MAQAKRPTVGIRRASRRALNMNERRVAKRRLHAIVGQWVADAFAFADSLSFQLTKQCCHMTEFICNRSLFNLSEFHSPR